MNFYKYGNENTRVRVRKKNCPFLIVGFAVRNGHFLLAHGVRGKNLRARVNINSYLLCFKESSSFKCKAFVVLTQTRQAKLEHGLNCFRKPKSISETVEKKRK